MQYRTVLIIFRLLLQTITAQMLSIGVDGVKVKMKICHPVDFYIVSSNWTWPAVKTRAS